ncbi:hypothetical protein [Chitinophaga sp. Cy-1792]|uniref:hypothetical protein n=1 Tax=Chitinophaga sp. Cy-1792 TaxID=2608339 RepID=UPI0014228022|nr:hypothetical protein [Chitinophaga sp. Cy-1792]NIG52745.1 hypothetical protein [Chitinophaga sp. Cy-1792]
MKNVKLLTGAIAVMLSIYSCTKTDNPSPDTNTNPGTDPGTNPIVVTAAPLLDSLIEIENNGTPYNWIFRYNTDSTLQAELHSSGAKPVVPYGDFFTYNSKKQVVRHNYANPANIQDTLASDYYYVYDNAGRLALTKSKAGIVVDSFVYNDKSRLSGKFGFDGKRLRTEEVFTWTGNNLTLIKSTQYLIDQKDPYIRTYAYKYDDKKNAAINVRACAVYTRSEMDYWLSENNCTQIVETEPASTTTTSFTFTYNDKNYPVSASYTVKDGTTTLKTGTQRFVYKK